MIEDQEDLKWTESATGRSAEGAEEGPLIGTHAIRCHPEASPDFMRDFLRTLAIETVDHLFVDLQVQTFLVIGALRAWLRQ